MVTTAADTPLFSALDGSRLRGFPPSSTALKEPNGLLAVGGDLNESRLLEAYRRGIFPWYSAGQPLLWWSPDPRAVIYPSELHVSRSLRRLLRRGDFRVTCDNAFDAVIDACAAPRAGADGTWITPAMQHAYRQLHRRGIAHSIECWRDDELCGGVYGLAIGRVFFGESMFSRVANASKVALATLAAQLVGWDYGLIDCQVENPHLATLGATNIARADFEQALQDLTTTPPATDAWQNPGTALEVPAGRGL